MAGGNQWMTSTVSTSVGEVEGRYHWMQEFPFGPATLHRRRLESREDIFVTSVEGRLDAAAADDRAARRALGDVVVRIRRAGMVVLEMAADLITPQDSVLEARVASLESMLAHLVGLDDTAASERQRKTRDALQRLGWTPPEVVDHRRLPIPIHLGGCEEYEVEITSPIPIKWTCILAGITTRPTS